MISDKILKQKTYKKKNVHLVLLLIESQNLMNYVYIVRIFNLLLYDLEDEFYYIRDKDKAFANYNKLKDRPSFGLLNPNMVGEIKQYKRS